MNDWTSSNVRRIVVSTGTEIYPATVAYELECGDDEEATEIADSIWQRYVAADAEMKAVTALLEDLAEVDYAHRRCTTWCGEVRCSRFKGHDEEHFGYRGNGWDSRGEPTWMTWKD